MNPSVYTRPDKPKRVIERDRVIKDGQLISVIDVLEPVFVDRSTECFVTPLQIADRMVSYLEASPTMQILEPSAGTGNLVEALVNSDHSSGNIFAIERNRQLWQLMQGRFQNRVNGHNQCFLEYAERAANTIAFSRIIMNPPFSKGNTSKHIDAALSLLGVAGFDDAVLVALVPSSYTHSEAIVLEDLPAGTFENTRVRTKIIRFEWADD